MVRTLAEATASVLCVREKNPEGAPAADLRVELDPATVVFGSGLDDGQAESRSSLFAGPAGVDAVEALEHVIAVRGRDSRAVILHLDKGAAMTIRDDDANPCPFR